MILATPDDVWALRYPATHELYVPDHAESPGQLELSSKRIRTRSDELSGAPALILASEPMDGEKGWRLLDSGELLHIGPDLTITSSLPLPNAPRHPLTLADLSPVAAASQGAAAQQTS